jgi:5-formyltetrahydrofolate cyclo-ligase
VSGTDTNDIIERYREQIWEDLRRVARPDSRFHWDFSRFIPDFEGSSACADRVLALEAMTVLGERRIFIAPDNCLEQLRAQLLRGGIGFVMTTYGIGRGFQVIDPTVVPPAAVQAAATLDGFDRFARPISLAELRDGPAFGVCVTGGSAVSRNGVRFGKGHGYFDLEFAILSDLGLAGSLTSVVDVVHDCQYVDDDLMPEQHDVTVNVIITPTRTLPTSSDPRLPARVRWELVPGTEFETLGVLAELAEIQRRASPTFDASSPTSPSSPATEEQP